MDKDKTIPFDNTEDTLRMSVDKTLRMDANASSEKTGVSLKTTKGKKKTMNFFDAGNDSFLLNGKTYLVVETLSDSSGEAQVYLLENNGEKYVLKLYYPNFSPKLDLLEIIAGMNTEYVVRLFDYGIMTMGDSTRTFELMEYLSGGDLEACQLPDDKEQIFRKIAFASASSLRECHKHGIIHKDVKPTNFFFRDETRQQLVLGDFGISSLTEGEDQMHKTTQARTPVYAAPEMYTNVINGEVELTYKVDYYSLGITLLSFFLGYNPFKGTERSVMRMKTKGEIPELDKLPEYANRIIRGLMVVNPESRWGYNEVLRWYKGEDVPVVDNSPILYYKQFLFDAEKKLIANNVRELADLMKTDKAAAIRFLYSGKITKWLEDSGNEKLALEINDVVENIFPLNQQAGLAGCIYVMNPEQPFLFDSPYPSSTPAEIVKAFSHNENTEDEYKALTDGRLLLWLSTKNEPSLYEQIEELTKQKDYSIGLAYGVLYHLDKKCGFDLKEYTGRKQVGEIMNEALVKAQDIADEDQYKAHLHDFLGDKGRLYYYALTHKWDDVLKYMELCLDYNSKSGEQYGEHNYFIASYKFCTGLGYKPGYYLSRTEKTIYSQEELAKLSDKDISNEMRNGKLKYWLTVFYHEDPFRDFSEEYSFEKTLESYLNYVSKYNKADYYSKRFINAKESIEEQIKQFNGVFNKAIRLDLVSFLITAALSVFLLYLLQTHGISNKELFVKNYFVTVGVPILLFGLVYWGIKVYFLSMGVILSILSTIGGGILTLIPAIGAYWILADSPELSVPVASALVVVYLAIFFFSLCRKSTLKIRKLKRIGKRTIQSSLLDPLYFTYMVNASKYKSDTSIAITDGIEIIQDVRRKLSTHYVLWILLLACFVILFICISPDFLGIEVPEITWENIKVFFRLRND